MTEGVIGAALGDDEEKPDTEGTEAGFSADAFAAAVAAIASKQDPQVAKDTSAYLRAQSNFINVQKSQLEEAHSARLRYLRGQAREVDLRRLGLILRVASQLILVAILSAFGIFGFMLVRDAVTSRRVFVEPLRVSAVLSARGFDGTIVASAILDSLSGLQDATRATETALGQSGAWADDIKLEIPETGISLSEITQALSRRFGQNIRIVGDLAETSPGSIVLTIRGNGISPQAFSGNSSDLNKLVNQAAEHIYSTSQPSRWASYLINHDRRTEAVEFCRKAMASADNATRAALLNDWGNAVISLGGAAPLAFYRQAIKLKPDYWRTYTNLMNNYMLLGQEEEAWRVGKAMLTAAGGRPGKAGETSYANWDLLTWNVGASLQASLDDAAAGGADASGTAVGPAGVDIATDYMQLHDPEAAQLELETLTDASDSLTVAISHFVSGRLAADRGDGQKAVLELEAFGAAFANPAVSSNYPGYDCWIAPAEEAVGHRDKADAILDRTASFVDCYRFRADILDGRGDWNGAQDWYEKSVALAPDLPAGYYSWGVALARHGDFVAAEAKFNLANQRGPHWADPLKGWGDVLMREGKSREALRKYDEALKFAPNWKELKNTRETVANQRA